MNEDNIDISKIAESSAWDNKEIQRRIAGEINEVSRNIFGRQDREQPIDHIKW